MAASLFNLAMARNMVWRCKLLRIYFQMEELDGTGYSHGLKLPIELSELIQSQHLGNSYDPTASAEAVSGISPEYIQTLSISIFSAVFTECRVITVFILL